MKNRRGRYRRILLWIMAIVLIVVILPQSFFAAQQVRINAIGNIHYIPEEKLVQDLDDAGFDVLVDSNKNIIYDENGNITLADGTTTGISEWYEMTFFDTRHDALISLGILSYEVYEGDACGVGVVAVLDFSSYGVAHFSGDCLQGMRTAIMGNLANSHEETATVYDSATGSAVGTATLTLGGIEGIKIFGRQGSSSMTKTVNGVTTQNVAISGFTLRIVPPTGVGEITFAPESLEIASNLLKPPVIIEFDLRRFTDIDKLVLQSNVTGNSGTKHMHMLCRKESQLKYEIADESSWTIEKYNFTNGAYVSL